MNYLNGKKTLIYSRIISKRKKERAKKNISAQREHLARLRMALKRFQSQNFQEN